MVITDDLGDELRLDKLPERIVSLVPSITETLVELGAGDRLVGVTDYCIHPKPAVVEIPKVGGTKGILTETIDSLKPDLVIANKEENRKDEINALRRAYHVFVTYPRTVEQAMKTVLDLGTLTGAQTKASKIAETCDHIITSTDPDVLGTPLGTACMVWREPWLAAGPDTYVSSLLEIFGFRNVFNHGQSRYPVTSLENLLDRRPDFEGLLDRNLDVVILPTEPYEFDESNRREVEAFFKENGQHVEALLIDGSYVTWFGYRTIQGLRFLRHTKTRLLSQ